MASKNTNTCKECDDPIPASDLLCKLCRNLNRDVQPNDRFQKCTICHSELVDTYEGFDTCDYCLKEQ